MQRATRFDPTLSKSKAIRKDDLIDMYFVK
jgi:hypothetical protein